MARRTPPPAAPGAAPPDHRTARRAPRLPPWLRPEERATLRAFAHGVRRIAGPDLVECRLYGSRARGEGHAESDLDVLVVVRRAARHAHRIRDLAGDLMDAAGWPVAGQLSQCILSKSQWRFLLDRELLFGREVLRDGIPL